MGFWQRIFGRRKKGLSEEQFQNVLSLIVGTMENAFRRLTVDDVNYIADQMADLILDDNRGAIPFGTDIAQNVRTFFEHCPYDVQDIMNLRERVDLAPLAIGIRDWTDDEWERIFDCVQRTLVGKIAEATLDVIQEDFEVVARYVAEMFPWDDVPIDTDSLSDFVANMPDLPEIDRIMEIENWEERLLNMVLEAKADLDIPWD